MSVSLSLLELSSDEEPELLPFEELEPPEEPLPCEPLLLPLDGADSSSMGSGPCETSIVIVSPAYPLPVLLCEITTPELTLLLYE